jgi:hypothetical protein
MAYRFSTGQFNSLLATMKTDLANGVIKFYTGSQPASPDDAPTGTYMGMVTLSAGAWTAGTVTNGLEFDAPVLASMNKAAAEEWKFKTVAIGTIGWGRFVSNSASDTGQSSTSLVRHDFSVGVTSGDCKLEKVTFTAIDQTAVISDYTIPLANIS